MVNELILSPEHVTAITTRLGENVIINHMPRFKLQTLAEQGVVDTIIVDSEDGFSQLGMMRRFISVDLGIAQRNLVKHVLDGFPSTLERNISSLADWNRFEAPDVTLIAIPSSRQEGLLRGVILSPYECCKCYEKYAVPEHSKAYRDFFYNVTFEAISYVYKVWGAKNIGLTHLASYRSSDARRLKDVTMCQIEAIVHFCNENTGIESFTLVGDQWSNCPLEVVRQFNNMESVGSHRAINTRSEEKWGIEFIHIDWSSDAQI